MPIDLTDRIQQFRLAGYQLGPASSPDDVATLFRTLVMYPLPADAAEIPASDSGEVLDRYRVHPTPQASALVSTDIPASGDWGHPITHLDPSAVDLRLISFFDWEAAETRTFQYLRVRIVHANDATLVGRDALLETGDCRVEYVD